MVTLQICDNTAPAGFLSERGSRLRIFRFLILLFSSLKSYIFHLCVCKKEAGTDPAFFR